MSRLVNLIGGYYCQCPEHQQLVANSITVYPEEIPESSCSGYPTTHLNTYVCANADPNGYGFEECTCVEDGGGTKLVANTGGCLGWAHI